MKSKTKKHEISFVSKPKNDNVGFGHVEILVGNPDKVTATVFFPKNIDEKKAAMSEASYLSQSRIDRIDVGHGYSVAEKFLPGVETVVVWRGKAKRFRADLQNEDEWRARDAKRKKRMKRFKITWGVSSFFLPRSEPIGTVDSARIDSDGVARAKVRFKSADRPVRSLKKDLIAIKRHEKTINGVARKHGITKQAVLKALIELKAQ